MKNIMDLLKITNDQKYYKGVWLSGIEMEGEFKRWWPNGQLKIFSNCKGRKLHGYYKRWRRNGQLFEYELWGEGKLIKDLLKE